MEKRVDQHAGLQIQKTILETEIKTSPALFRVKVGCAILFFLGTLSYFTIHFLILAANTGSFEGRSFTTPAVMISLSLLGATLIYTLYHFSKMIPFWRQRNQRIREIMASL